MINVKQKLLNTFFGLKENIPVIIGILLLISMLNYTPTFSYLSNLHDNFFSVIIADIIGSISAGNPINSYIIASQMGNLQNKMIIISTFLVAWVTVGIIQIPGEICFFGKKFAILRNLLSFIFAMLAAVVVYFIFRYF